MSKAYDPDGFTLDLRHWPPAWQEPARLDSWTSNDSPLEHFEMAVANCSRYKHEAARVECRDIAWSDHLAACITCSRAESEQRIKAFARALRAEREEAA